MSAGLDIYARGGMSKDEHLLEEKEAWWCQECESHSRFRSIPTEGMAGHYCSCDDFIHGVSLIPDKFIPCKVRVTKNEINS